MTPRSRKRGSFQDDRLCRMGLRVCGVQAETDARAGEESRLKAGCSQDWLPHKRPINNRPQVNNLPHKVPQLKVGW
jgi:hypothetical protein